MTVADTVAGGAGTDTLSLTVANGAFVSVANAANVSGIETLSLASAAATAALTMDMDAISGHTKVTVGDTNNQRIDVTDMGVDVALAITGETLQPLVVALRSTIKLILTVTAMP